MQIVVNFDHIRECHIAPYVTEENCLLRGDKEDKDSVSYFISESAYKAAQKKMLVTYKNELISWAKTANKGDRKVWSITMPKPIGRCARTTGTRKFHRGSVARFVCCYDRFQMDDGTEIEGIMIVTATVSESAEEEMRRHQKEGSAIIIAGPNRKK